MWLFCYQFRVRLWPKQPVYCAFLSANILLSTLKNKSQRLEKILLLSHSPLAGNYRNSLGRLCGLEQNCRKIICKLVVTNSNNVIIDNTVLDRTHQVFFGADSPLPSTLTFHCIHCSSWKKFSIIRPKSSFYCRPCTEFKVFVKQSKYTISVQISEFCRLPSGTYCTVDTGHWTLRGN